MVTESDSIRSLQLQAGTVGPCDSCLVIAVMPTASRSNSMVMVHALHTEEAGLNSMIGVACWPMPSEEVCEQQGRHHQHVRHVVGLGRVKLCSLRFASLLILAALERCTCV